MADMMNFPKRWEDFLHNYEFEDSRRVYTNGSRLIQSFRVEQMLWHTTQDYCAPSRNHVYSICCNECEMMFGWDIDYGGRYDTEYEAILAWNTRAPILSVEKMEMLEGME